MTTLGTFTSGSVLTAAELNQFNNVTWVFQASLGISKASGSEETISFTSPTRSLDVSSWHSTSVNPERITPTIAGYYLVFGMVGWLTFGGTEGDVYTILRKNANQAGLTCCRGDFVPHLHCTTIVELNGTTDYVTIGGWQDSGTRTINNAELGVILLRKT
jgi:hypothetical protein